MNNRNLILAAVALVAFGAAAYFFVFAGSDTVTISDTFVTHGVCLACKWNGTVETPTGQIPPHECPQCNEAAFYPYFYCFECNVRFVPWLIQRSPGEPYRVPPMPRCPQCGSSSVMQFMPEIVEDENGDYTDLPLPEWE